MIDLPVGTDIQEIAEANEYDLIEEFVNSDDGFKFWENEYAGEMLLTKENYCKWLQTGGHLELKDIPEDFVKRWVSEFLENGGKNGRRNEKENEKDNHKQ